MVPFMQVARHLKHPDSDLASTRAFNKACFLTTYLQSETDFRPSCVSVSFRSGTLSNNHSTHYEVVDHPAEGASCIRKIENAKNAKEIDRSTLQFLKATQVLDFEELRNQKGMEF
jgi:hypothetical protein